MDVSDILRWAREEIALAPILSTGILSSRLLDSIRLRYGPDATDLNALLSRLRADTDIITTVIRRENVSENGTDVSLQGAVIGVESTSATPALPSLTVSAGVSSNDQALSFPLLRFVPSDDLVRRTLGLGKHQNVTSDQHMMLCLVGRRRAVGLPYKALQGYFTYLSAAHFRDSVDDLLHLGMMRKMEAIVTLQDGLSTAIEWLCLGRFVADAQPEPLSESSTSSSSSSSSASTGGPLASAESALVAAVLAQSQSGVLAAFQVAERLGWRQDRMSNYVRRAASGSGGGDDSTAVAVVRTQVDGQHCIALRLSQHTSSGDPSVSSAGANSSSASTGSSDVPHVRAAIAAVQAALADGGSALDASQVEWLRMAVALIQGQEPPKSAQSGAASSNPVASAAASLAGRGKEKAKKRGPVSRRAAAAAPLFAVFQESFPATASERLVGVDWTAPAHVALVDPSSGRIVSVHAGVTGLNGSIDAEMAREEDDADVQPEEGQEEGGEATALPDEDDDDEMAGADDEIDDGDDDVDEDEDGDEDEGFRRSRAGKGRGRSDGTPRRPGHHSKPGPSGGGGNSVASYHRYMKRVPAEYRDIVVPAPPPLLLSFAGQIAPGPADNTRRRVAWAALDDAKLLAGYAWDKVLRERAYQERHRGVLRSLGLATAGETFDPDVIGQGRRVLVQWAPIAEALGVDMGFAKRRLKGLLKVPRLAASLRDSISRLRGDVGVVMYSHDNSTIMGDPVGVIPPPDMTTAPAPRLLEADVQALRARVLVSLEGSVASAIEDSEAPAPGAAHAKTAQPRGPKISVRAASSAVGLGAPSALTSSSLRASLLPPLPPGLTGLALARAVAAAGGPSAWDANPAGDPGPGHLLPTRVAAPMDSEGSDSDPMLSHLVAFRKLQQAAGSAPPLGLLQADGALVSKTVLLLLHGTLSDVIASEAASPLPGAPCAPAPGSRATTAEYDAARTALLEELGGSFFDQASPCSMALRLLQRQGWAGQLSKRQQAAQAAGRAKQLDRRYGRSMKVGAAALTEGGGSADGNDEEDSDAAAGASSSAASAASSLPPIVLSTSALEVLQLPPGALPRGLIAEPALSAIMPMLNPASSPPGGGPAPAAAPAAGGLTLPVWPLGGDVAVLSAALAAGLTRDIPAAAAAVGTAHASAAVTGSDVVSSGATVGVSLPERIATAASLEASLERWKAVQVRMQAEEAARLRKRLRRFHDFGMQAGEGAAGGAGAAGGYAEASTAGQSSGASLGPSPKRARIDQDAAGDRGKDEDDSDDEDGDGGSLGGGGDVEDEDEADVERAMRAVARLESDQAAAARREQAEAKKAQKAAAAAAAGAAGAGGAQQPHSSGMDVDAGGDVPTDSAVDGFDAGAEARGDHDGGAGPSGRKQVGAAAAGGASASSSIVIDAERRAGAGASVGVVTLLEREVRERRQALLQHGHALVESGRFTAPAAGGDAHEPDQQQQQQQQQAADGAGAASSSSSGPGTDAGGSTLDLSGYAGSMVTRKGVDRMAAVMALNAAVGVARRVRNADIEPVPELLVTVHQPPAQAAAGGPAPFLPERGLGALIVRSQALALALQSQPLAVAAAVGIVTAGGANGASIAAITDGLAGVGVPPELGSGGGWDALPLLLRHLAVRHVLMLQATAGSLLVLPGRWGHVVALPQHACEYTVPVTAAPGSSGLAATRTALHVWSGITRPGPEPAVLRALVRALLHAVSESPCVSEVQLVRKFALCGPGDVRTLLRWLARCGLLTADVTLARASSNAGTEAAPTSSELVPGLEACGVMLTDAFAAWAVMHPLAQPGGGFRPAHHSAFLGALEATCGEVLPVPGACTSYLPDPAVQARLQALLG